VPVTPTRPLRRMLALMSALGTVVAGTLVATPAAVALAPDTVCASGSCTQTFDYVGDLAQTWTVPAGVTSLHALLVGGSGRNLGAPGGTGGVVAGDLAVVPGQVLKLRVGAHGANGGYGGGMVDGGGGGGTFLSRSADLLLVAGGGGSGGTAGNPGGNGGGGLTLVGQPGATGAGGHGATTAAPGAGAAGGEAGTGPATTTTFGRGGMPLDGTGGGGGGGFFGGGGGGTNQAESFGGGGGGSGYADSAVELVEPGPVPSSDTDGSVTLTYAAPAVTPTAAPAAPAAPTATAATTTAATIALAADHAVAGGATTATVTVTADGETDFAGGVVRLLVDGKASGAPVAVTAAGTTATAKLTVPATGVAVHQVSATFSATDPALASTARATSFTVLPATLPWTLVDETGAPVTTPLATPEAIARATGQLPGATVHLEVELDGTWTDLEFGESGVVAADGTVDVPVVGVLLLTALSENFTEDATFNLRLVAESGFDDTPDLVSTARKLTVPGMDIAVDLQVDPGPYRTGADVDNAVRVTVRWFNEEGPLLGATDIVDALDVGFLRLYLDGEAIDPQDIGVDESDDETAVLTFAAPQAGGDHTVQAVLDLTEDVASASDVRHFTVAPSTFDAALLDEAGNPVTTVHPGDELLAVASGLLEETVVDFDLHSEPVLLGSAAADADGVAAAEVTIPANAEPGKHTLVVTATDVLGDEHVQRVEITVVAAPAPTPSVTPVDGPLAATGSEATPLAGLGAVLLLVGAGLVLAVRRRTA
jgi:LPXTG-motif cell wall-anchored protein